MHPFDAAWSILKAIRVPPIRNFEYLGTHRTFDREGNPVFRDVGVMVNINAVTGKVDRFPFYRSSGRNSGEAGSWKPFRGVTTQPKEVELFGNQPQLLEDGRSQAVRFKHTPNQGWFIKPQLTDSAYANPHYFGESLGFDKEGNEIKATVRYPDKRARYGHALFEDHADWMNENVGNQQFDQNVMRDAFLNEALINAGAVNMSDMAQPPTENDRWWEMMSQRANEAAQRQQQ